MVLFHRRCCLRAWPVGHYHPERWLESSSLVSADRPIAEALVAEKMKWIDTPKTRATAERRHRAIEQANSGLRRLLDPDRQRAERALQRAGEAWRAAEILTSREYAFCLYPPNELRRFLLDFGRQLP